MAYSKHERVHCSLTQRSERPAKPSVEERLTLSDSILNLTIDDSTVSVMTPRTMTFVERYRSSARKTAESVIELATTLVEAEQTLDQFELREFFREVRIEPKSPVYKKLKVIAEKATRFDAHMQRLPGAWTTLYKLAALPANDFDRLAQTDALSPHMTAPEIDAALNRSVLTRKKQRKSFNVFFDLSSASDALCAQFYDKVKRFAAELGIRIKVSDDLLDDIEVSKRGVPNGTVHNVTKVV